MSRGRSLSSREWFWRRYTIATISSGVRFYSRGAVQALFLKHDGFVGVMGAHVTGHLGRQGKVVRMPDSDPFSTADATQMPKSPSQAHPTPDNPTHSAPWQQTPTSALQPDQPEAKASPGP